MDERAIILTDKYIYKSDPKRNFQIKRSGISLDDVTGLSITPGKEQLIVIHLVSNQDLIFYMETKIDRVGEFVGYMIKLKQNSYRILFYYKYIFYLFYFRSNFFVNVQRNVPINMVKHKYVIDIIWDRLGKIEFRKGSNNNISLMLPDSK